MSSASSSPQPMAQGTLAKTPLANLLVYMEQRRLPGTRPNRRRSAANPVHGISSGQTAVGTCR
jgi:hypothetical protein